MANPRSCAAAAAAVLHNAQVCAQACHSIIAITHVTAAALRCLCQVSPVTTTTVQFSTEFQLTFSFTGTNLKDSVSAKAAPPSTPPTLATPAQCRRHNLHCQAPALASVTQPAPLITCQGPGHRATDRPRSSLFRRTRALLSCRRAPDRHRQGR